MELLLSFFPAQCTQDMYDKKYRLIWVNAGLALAADHPEWPSAHHSVQPRSRLVRRCGRNVHLRRCRRQSWVRSRGLPAEVGMSRLVRLRGSLNDLWLFSHEAGSGVNNRHPLPFWAWSVQKGGPDQFVPDALNMSEVNLQVHNRGIANAIKRHNESNTLCQKCFYKRSRGAVPKAQHIPSAF